jgi:hypothetical protein
MKTEHWVEYSIPGTFFSESENKQLDSQNVEQALEHMPRSAFAFHFYEVKVQKGKLEDGEVIEDRKTINRSQLITPAQRSIQPKMSDENLGLTRFSNRI